MYPYKSHAHHEILDIFSKNERPAAPVTDFNRVPSRIVPRKAPSLRPPRIAPKRDEILELTDTEALRRCADHLIYIWPKTGKSAWMFLTHASGGLVQGYIWTAVGWQYISLDERSIDGFYCFGY